MARQTGRRRTWIGIGLVLGVIALSAGAWGLREWSPFVDDEAALEWPENVQPIVDFVEETTGFRFREAVPITFVQGQQRYEDLVNPEPPDPTEQDVDDAAVAAAAGRALGFWSGDVDLIEWDRAFSTSPPGPVTWWGDTNEIVMQGSRRDTELDVPKRVDLAAVLTQALDEQLFHIVERANETESFQQFQVFNGMLVNHALLVRDEYVDQELDADELMEWFEHVGETEGRFVAGIDDAAPAFRLLRASGPGVGDGFIAALAEEPELLRAAFTTDAPEALDQLMLPTAKYLRRDPLEHVEAPAPPAGAEERYVATLGPVGLFIMVAAGSEPRLALTAADGWGGDQYTVYELDGRVCLDLHMVADSLDDADRIEDGLNAWARTRKPETGALLGREGVHLYLSACDPGMKPQKVPQEAKIQHLFDRATELKDRIDLSRKPALSECIAVELFARFNEDAMFDFESNYFETVTEIEEDCLDLE